MPRLSQSKRIYRDTLKSERWKAIRRQVVFRDKATCRWCGSRNRLEVHHLTYARRGHEHLDDLITLCAKCHHSAHQQHKANT